MPVTISPPKPDEFFEYYGRYIELAKARDDVLAALPKQIEEIASALGTLTDEQALFRDAPKEWTIKEVLGHINDVERIFAYRLLCISRNDLTPLPGFEQEDYVRESTFNAYPIRDLVQEFEYLRRANILAIRNLSKEAIDRRGTASGYPFSVRALIYALVGHVEHHMASLHEKYLTSVSAL
jgi:uncharacterized damage-inducible protein DinB